MKQAKSMLAPANVQPAAAPPATPGPHLLALAKALLMAVGAFLLISTFIFSDFTFDEYTNLHNAWRADEGDVPGKDFATVYPVPFYTATNFIFRLFPEAPMRLLVCKLVQLFFMAGAGLLLAKLIYHQTRNRAFAILATVLPFATLYGMPGDHIHLWRGVVEYRIDALALLLLVGAFYLAETATPLAFIPMALLAMTFTPRPVYLIIPFAFYYLYTYYQAHRSRPGLPAYLIQYLTLTGIGWLVVLVLLTKGHPFQGYFNILLSHYLDPLDYQKNLALFHFICFEHLRALPLTVLLILPLLAVLYRRDAFTVTLGFAYALFFYKANSASTQWFLWAFPMVSLFLGRFNLRSKVALGLISALLLAWYGFNFTAQMRQSKMVSDLALQKQRDYFLPSRARVLGETFGWPLYRTNAFNFILYDHQKSRNAYFSTFAPSGDPVAAYYRYFENYPPDYINLFAVLKIPNEAMAALQQYVNQHKDQYTEIRENYDGWGDLKSIPALLRK